MSIAALTQRLQGPVPSLAVPPVPSVKTPEGTGNRLTNQRGSLGSPGSPENHQEAREPAHPVTPVTPPKLHGVTESDQSNQASNPSNPGNPENHQETREPARRLWLIEHADGRLISHAFTPPATLAEIGIWYPDARSIEPEILKEQAA